MTLLEKESGQVVVAEPTIGELVQDISTNLSTIVRGEIELAKLELRSSVKSGGTGAVFFVAAVVLLLFAVPVLLIGFAELLHRYLMPRWVGYMVVFAVMLALAGLFVWLGIKKVKKVKAPEKTIATAQETAAYLKSARKSI